MTGVLYGIFEFLATFLESYLSYTFMSLFLRHQKSRKRTYFILSFLISLMILVINSFSLFSYLTLGIAVLFVSITSVIAFGISFLDAFAVSFFFSFCLLFFDFFSITVLGFCLGAQRFAAEVVQIQSVGRCLFIGISKVLLLLSLLFVRKFLPGLGQWKKRNLIFFSIAGYIGIFYFSKLSFRFIDANIVVHWFLFLLIVLSTVFSLVIYLYYKRTKDEKTVIEMRNEFMAESYHALSKDYRAHAQLYHDMKNHTAVLNSLIESKKYEQTKRYINSLLDVSTMLQRTWTGNDIIDCIINMKEKDCEQLGVTMTIDADPFPMDLDYLMISTIFSNLLDNAIQACAGNDGESRWITVAIRHINDMLMLKMENSICQREAVKNHIPILQKSGKKHHGWGLKSVEAAVNKADGVFTYSASDERFTVMVLLFL